MARFINEGDQITAQYTYLQGTYVFKLLNEPHKNTSRTSAVCHAYKVSLQSDKTGKEYCSMNCLT